jgi:hypothetical protein
MITKKLYKEIITQLAINKYDYKCKDCGLIYFDRESDSWCCKGSSADPEHKAVCYCFTPHKGCHNYTDPKTWKDLVEIPEPSDDKPEEPEKKLTNHEKILERLKDPEIMVDYLQSCPECPLAESCAGRLEKHWLACRRKLKLWLKS